MRFLATGGTTVLAIAGGVFAPFVAFFVGGVYVAVAAERTECTFGSASAVDIVGIRRAVGAKKRNIMTQFIIEAIVLCEIGGVIGVLCGILGGNSTAYLFKLDPVIPLDWIGLGLLICSVVGVVFGTYPAQVS